MVEHVIKLMLDVSGGWLRQLPKMVVHDWSDFPH